MKICREQWKERFDHLHQSTGEFRKLEPRFRGLYVVAKVIGKDTYLLEDIKGMQVSQNKFTSVYTAWKMKGWCVLHPDDDSDYEDDIGTMSGQEGPSCHEWYFVLHLFYAILDFLT